MDRLELDYAQTTELIRTLTDVRFKLLALVPTISGGAVALLGRHPSSAQLLAVGAIGLAATLGIALYEIRNTEIHDYAVYRARVLEAKLGELDVFELPPGGLYRERPYRRVHLLGLAVAHDRGLALVYGAALAGWSYLVAWGALGALDVGHAQKVAGAVAVVAGLLVAGEFLRVDTRPSTRQAAATPPEATRVHA